MADPRTFTLIGEFRDGITPELAKINKQLAALKANFAGIGSRKNTGFRGATQEIGKLVSAHKTLANSIKGVQGELRSTVGVLSQYRKEMGKAAAATRSFQKAGGNLGGTAFTKNIREANQAAKAYLSTLRQIQSAQPRAARAPRVPAGGGRGGVSGGGGSFAAAAGGVVAGSQLGDMLTGSIVRGFQLGVTIMQKPFQYAANAFGERIRDELTDIQSAGGLFATDQRKNLGMFRDFQEARTAQEAINYRLAKSAAALPGATAQYVQEAKRVTDTMIGAMAKQPQQFVKLGEEFGAKTGDKMDALGAVIQKFTEKSVLLGKGGGGYRGMYSMPMLLEMMVNRPEVNAQAMGARYSVLRDNPMLMNAISEAEDEINKTGAGTADRLRVLMKVLDQALPNEVVQGMKNSMDGIIEVIKSSFLDPEVGLFGLGRKMKGIGPAVDQFGRYVNDQGKVVSSLGEAAKADLSIFMILRDTIGGFALPLSELAQILPELFDPLRRIGEGMVRFRTIAQKFYANFNQYTAEFEALAKETGGKAGAEIKRTAGARGALLSVANLLRGFGAIDVGKYQDVAKKLQQEKPDLGAITGDLFKTLFSSDVMKTIGEAVGTLFGSVIKMTGDLMAGVTDMTTAGPFAAGLKKGWDASGGSEGISKVFSSLFKVIGNLLIIAFKSAPFEMSILTALTVGMPLIAGAISAGITALFQKMLGGGGLEVMKGMSEGGQVGKTGRNKRGGFFSSPYNERRRQRFMRPYAQGAKTLGAFGQDALSSGLGLQPGRAMIRQRGMIGNLARTGAKMGRVVPGGALAGGAIDMGLALASGESFGKAAAGTIGTVLGGVAGSAFGPVGTMIGMAAGGMIGDATADAIAKINKGPTLDQQKAAEMQINAAKMQEQAAKLQSGGLAPEQATYTLGNAQQFSDRLTVLGLSSDKAAQSLNKLYAQREYDAGNAKTAADALNKKITELKKQNIPPDLIAKQVRPLQDQFNEATKKLRASQAAFDSEFRKTPKVIQQSITNSLSALSFKNVETILANKIAGLNIEPPKMAFTLPSGQPQTQVNIPNWNNAYNNPYLNAPPPKPSASTLNPIFSRAKGSLGDAIASEMRMKPPGSDLIVANSSETVIPAAGGYGMMDFVETLRSGFNAVVSTYKEAQAKQDSTLKSINATLINNQQQTNAKFAALSAKMNTPSMPGGLGGASAGGVDAFTPIAQKYGLQMTSGYRPGDPGWHGANRARDFSNGTGPTPQMMQFAQYMASAYGSNLKELIYTPLGFSIKNGQKVAPYAQGSHYNHVHVAYAMGLGQGVAFNSLSGAQAWERSMVPGSMKVASVTANSGEGFGGGTTINGGINVTVNGSGVNDADELASIVAIKIGEAVADARAASIFV